MILNKSNFKISYIKFIWISILLFINIVIITLLYNYSFSDKIYSYLFIFDYIIAFLGIWYTSGKKITPFVLFYMTFGLFIGGRFIAVALSPYYDTLWDPTIFIRKFKPSNELNQETFINIIEFILFVSIGYIIIKKINIIKPSKKNYFDFSDKEKNILNKILTYIFPILFIYIIYGSVKAFIEAISGGYLSLYEGQGADDEGGFVNSIFSTLYSIFFGMALAIGFNNNRKKYICLFVINAFIIMMVGSRGGFGASILLLLWIYSDTHKISIKKLATYGITSILLLLFIFSFSIRGQAKGFSLDDLNLVLATFFYGQGVSMMVFNVSKLVPSFPTLSYFTAVFPFAVPIYRIVSGEKLSSFDFSFSNYLSYYINPNLYFEGQGLGWTILGDIYLLSFNSVVLFCLLALILGSGFAWVENKAKYHNFWKIFLYSFITNIVILPRGTIMRILPKILPFAIYLLLFIMLIRLILNIKNRNKWTISPVI